MTICGKRVPPKWCHVVSRTPKSPPSRAYFAWARMPLGSFTLFTALGAGVWTAVLTFVGWAIGRSTAHISYLDLCLKGKAMAADNLPLVVGGAVALVALYCLVSKLVMKGNAK